MVLQLLLILGIIIVGAYIFGVGTDFLDDVFADVEAALQKQKDVPDQEDSERANFAEDRNTRVCDLTLTWFATMVDFDPTVILDINLTEERFILHGAEVRNVFGEFSTFNSKTYDYSWKCDGEVILDPTDTNLDPTKFQPPTTTTVTTSTGEMVVMESAGSEGSTGSSEVCRTGARGIIVCEPLTFFQRLAWNLSVNTQEGLDELALLAFGASETAGELIIVNFVGFSKTQGATDKQLFSPELPGKGTFDQPFTKSKKLGEGADFPVSYTIQTTLKDVTEDDYSIFFWDDKYKQNGEPVGHMFEIAVCKPGRAFGICQ